MNFIQTLYCHKSIDPLNHHFGWIAPEFHLMGWALSSLLLRSINYNVDLYCNSSSAYLLGDKLGLPYNNLHTTKHDQLLLPDINLWALPKIITYSLQVDPFIHIDGDVFIFNKLPDSLLKSELISQNLEEVSEYYLETKKQIEESLNYLPPSMRTDFNRPEPLKTFNAGIIGGSNVKFIRKFSKMALRLVYENVTNLNKINTDAFNVFFEQHLFYCLAKDQNVKVSVLFEELIENNYTGLGDFHEVPVSRNYLHLLGNYKRDEFTCLQMASRLRHLYPEYFYRVLSLFKKDNSRYILGIYADKEFNSLDEYLAFGKKAKLIYSQWIYNDSKKENGEPGFDNISHFSEILAIRQLIQKIDYSVCSCLEEEICADFDLFIENIQAALDCLFQKYSTDYLCGRDLEAEEWYSFLFADEKQVQEKSVVACKDTHILKSLYDWGGVINKWKRKGTGYYENLELENGEYYSIVVPGIFCHKFSVYDMDTMEKIILEKLANILSINQLINEMKEYVDEEVLNNHFEKYVELIIVFLKQLVLKKAVRPAAIDTPS